MEDLPKCKVVGILQNSGTTQEHNNRVYSADGISPTLTAVSGGTHHIKIFDPSRYRVRKLTPTEYGRLQAFPMDQWKQVVSDSQAYKQFGNAVTVTLFSAIAAQIAKAIFEAETRRNAGEFPADMEEISMDETRKEYEEQDTETQENTQCIAAADLSEKIITHLFERTYLPGFVFDTAKDSVTEYLENNMSGLYIGEMPEDTRDWDAAERAVKVAEIGISELKRRLEAGERTTELFNAIVDATR